MRVKIESFLREVCEKTTKNNEYPVLTSSKSGLFLQSDYFNKQVASTDNTGYKIIKKGQFTYRAMSDTGEFYPNMLECVDVGIVSPAYPVFEIFQTDIIIPEYLKYYFKSNAFQHAISSFAQGSTRTSVKFNKLKTASIDLPSKQEQTKILRLLKKAETLIACRQQELHKLDDLVKARFVEMFGNLETNEKCWIEKPLGELCEKVIRYPTFYGMDYLASGTRVIRIGNILEDGHMDIDNANYVFVYDNVNNDYPETVIELFDIVMAVRGDGSAAKRIGIIREKSLVGANISPNLIRIKAADSMMHPVYLFYYLTGEVGQKRLDAYVNKTAKKNIAAKDIVKVIVPTPPKDLPQDFADFVQQIDKSKFVVQQALDKAQLFFDSLMQQYFG